MSYLKKSILLLMMFCMTAQSQNSLPEHFPALMPLPQQITVNEGRFNLRPDFTVSVEGMYNERIFPNATRFLRRLSGRTGMFFLQHYLTPEAPGRNGALKIITERAGVVTLGEDESYHLTVSEKGVLLKAVNEIGAIRGMETLLQLLNADENGYYFPAVDIADAPRFPWRGLLIDISRHFMPMDVIKRNLDAMAAVKLNVLHWHLVDDQGFRVESKVFPKLHEMGSDGFYYTQTQIREIVAYAAERGIRVIPEFDVPAHATSWLVGYPELGSAPGPYKIERTWGIHHPTLDPTKEEVYDFLAKFFGEIVPLFPDEYFHIGGDENNGKHWDASERIQAFMRTNNIADNHALQAHFNKRVMKILHGLNRKVIGWDEILHPDLPKTAVIHSWRGLSSMIDAAKQGYTSVLSNGYYIDLAQPAVFHYLNDPLPQDTPLSEDEQKRVLGGEATMWSELVSLETVDSRIWPRTAAIAERLWSDRSVRDVEDMYRRMERISFLLEEHGLLHIKNYEMMLRRLTNNNDTAPLKTLLDVAEPLEKYARHRQQMSYTSTSPLTRCVDAARPESMLARRFSRMVDTLLTNPTEQVQYRLIGLLQMWQANHQALEKLIEKSPVLREIETLSRDLSTVSDIALQTGKHLTSGTRPSEMWFSRIRQLLEDAKRPRGELELVIIAPVLRMLNTLENNIVSDKG